MGDAVAGLVELRGHGREGRLVIGSKFDRAAEAAATAARAVTCPRRRTGGGPDAGRDRLLAAEVADLACEADALVAELAGVFDADVVVLDLAVLDEFHRVALKAGLGEHHVAFLPVRLRDGFGCQFSPFGPEVEDVLLAADPRLELGLPLAGRTCRLGSGRGRRLFAPGDQFLRGEVTDLAGELDFVARHFARVVDRDVVALKGERFDKGHRLAGELAVLEFDRVLVFTVDVAGGFASDLFALGLQLIDVVLFADLGVEVGLPSAGEVGALGDPAGQREQAAEQGGCMFHGVCFSRGSVGGKQVAAVLRDQGLNSNGANSCRLRRQDCHSCAVSGET